MFTKEEIEKMIFISEERIVEMVKENEPLKRELEQATQMFNEASTNYNKGMEGVVAEQRLLEKFVQLRNNDGVPVRILRQTSHLNKPPKEGRVSWKPLIIPALQSLNRYVNFDELFDHMEYLQSKKLDKGKFLDTVNRYEERELKEFTFYHGKIGLIEWSEDKVPKAEYMKPFVYRD